MRTSEVAGRLERWKWVARALILSMALAVACGPAEARRRHHGVHAHAHPHFSAHHRRGAHLFHLSHRGAGGGPAFAAIVVDANSGRTLYGKNENEPRHPASITKVMTLYLLFEQLEKGRLRLDSPLVISAHAAAQAPTKLGLAPGQTIDVDNAIKAVVTKSANDIAAAIAENIAGDEDSFAELMTRKAHALGMSRTRYVNASGLPAEEQITTARDLAVLGRAIQDRFPRFYHYFSTRSFAWRGQSHRNHNHLLGQVRGMDGIKTGYTQASGFNLLTSVRRDGRHVVAVVLGGRSGAARDRAMAGLIAENLEQAAQIRTAHAIFESDAAPAAAAPASLSRDEADEQSEQPQRPAAAPLALAPALAPLTAPTPEHAEKIRPAFVAGGLQGVAPSSASLPASAARDARRPGTRRDAARAVADGSTSARAGAGAKIVAATTTPPAPPRAAAPERVQIAHADRTDSIKPELQRPATHAEWIIQIGATDDADKAQELLVRARAKGVPAFAKGFTEKVQKGKETLWRARFAGLEEGSAEATCRALKRSGFPCFATRN